jgi:hypothetical protein
VVEVRRKPEPSPYVGTVNLVGLERNTQGEAVLRLRRNSVFEVAATPAVLAFVQKLRAPFIARGKFLLVLGESAHKVAHAVKGKKPPPAAEPLSKMRALLQKLAAPSSNGAGPCVSYLSNGHAELTKQDHPSLHAALRHSLIVKPSHIVLGHSINFNRPAEEGFRGIGIFCGGGPFDLCVAYKKLPALFLSTALGGEWVDLQDATDLGVSTGWNLRDRMPASAAGEENEISVYYRDLIAKTLRNIKTRIPPGPGVREFPDSIALVFSGATSITGNYIELARTLSEPGSAVTAPPSRIALSGAAPQPKAAAAPPRVAVRAEETVSEMPEIEIHADVNGTETDVRERRILDFRRYLPASGRGLDVGTSNVVGSVRSFDGRTPCNIQRNAFLDVRSDVFTEKLLMKLGVDCFTLGSKRFVFGNPAFEFANIFEKSTRRPMKNGVMSPAEPDGVQVEGHVIRSVLGRAATPGEICAYSVQADPIDVERNAVYHSGAIETILRGLGYSPTAILEGQAVVYAELAEEDFTGIGISCGGGMFNICISYKSLPALAFSISRGGDWIDANVAQSLGLPTSQVCAIKEGGIDLNSPKGRIEEAICIYYRNLIHYSIETIREKFESAQNMPAFRAPISLVCAGGTSMIRGFIDVFRDEFRTINFPIAVREIRLARHPLRTVAHGCLEAALVETRSREEMAAAPKIERAAVTRVAAAPARASLPPATAAKTDVAGDGKSPWWVIVPVKEKKTRPRPLEGPACA